jgi:hypothetical protein
MGNVFSEAQKHYSYHMIGPNAYALLQHLTLQVLPFANVSQQFSSDNILLSCKRIPFAAPIASLKYKEALVPPFNNKQNYLI